MIVLNHTTNVFIEYKYTKNEQKFIIYSFFSPFYSLFALRKYQLYSVSLQSEINKTKFKKIEDHISNT